MDEMDYEILMMGLNGEIVMDNDRELTEEERRQAEMEWEDRTLRTNI